MFCIGDKVVYKTNSVCCVEALETPPFVGDKQKKYYKLRVLFTIGNEVIYAPCENESVIRKVVTEKQAEKCFELLKNLEVCNEELKHPSAVAERFQKLLSDHNIESSLLVLKELLLKKDKLEKEGKNLKQIEQQYLAVIKKVVTSELASVLEKPFEDIEQRIMQTLGL